MNRAQFMEQLNRLLSDVSQGEREEALDYYESYFDDAGVENEASVIQELGSPGKVAAIIKADLRESNDNYAEYTENGYEDTRTREEGNVPDQYTALSRSSTYQERHKNQNRRAGGNGSFGGGEEKNHARDGYHPKPRKNSAWVVLVIILLVFLSPFIKGTAHGIVGVIVFLVFLPFLVVFAVGAASLGLIVGAVGTAVVGIGICFTYPAAGILTIGVGCILMALGLLALVLLVWLAGRALPWLLRKVTDFFNKLINRERKDGAGV